MFDAEVQYSTFSKSLLEPSFASRRFVGTYVELLDERLHCSLLPSPQLGRALLGASFRRSNTEALGFPRGAGL